MSARAVADTGEGLILARVELAASPDRVFQALASRDVVEWWVRPGIFDTRDWTGEVRAGGRWRASGVGGGRPYALEGEFLELDPPRRLVHTWRGVGAPGEPSTVTYHLDPHGDGTHVTLRHVGFASRETCAATCAGWETSFERLAEWLAQGLRSRA
jgi:uncharacterized protein YndB with AHSA1/START domain